MISRDYTKELGLPSQKKTLPRPVAFVVLAIVAVGMSFGVAGVVKQSKEHGAAEHAATESTPKMIPGIAQPAATPAETTPAQ